MTIPVSAIIVTKNEQAKLPRCLEALHGFDEIIVVDSQSQDRTVAVAKDAGFEAVNFIWNKQYPKKRQWCLDNVPLKHDWVFFVDADEIVTDQLKAEISNLFAHAPDAAGYFVRGWHSVNGKVLRHGLQNNKIALFDRRKMEFPVVDDLDIPGMGEIEGHYQPVLKAGFTSEEIGQVKEGLIHDAIDDERAWLFRHQKYARWEMGMNAKDAWPIDPKPLRNRVKNFLRRNKFRPQLMFLVSFIFLLGFLDGNEGLKFAHRKMQYYKLIQ